MWNPSGRLTVRPLLSFVFQSRETLSFLNPSAKARLGRFASRASREEAAAKYGKLRPQGEASIAKLLLQISCFGATVIGWSFPGRAIAGHTSIPYRYTVELP